MERDEAIKDLLFGLSWAVEYILQDMEKHEYSPETHEHLARLHDSRQTLKTVLQRLIP